LKNSWARKIQVAALITTVPIGIGLALLPIAAIDVITRGACLDSKSRRTIDIGFASYRILNDWSSQLGLIMNDVVIIWRVSILYPGKRLLLLLLSLMSFATSGTGFAALALSSTVSTDLTINVSSSGAVLKADLANTLNNISNALSLATNLFSVVLIFFIFWKLCRFVGRTGFQHRSLTSSLQILLFLVDSGFIVCVGQITNILIGVYLTSTRSLTTERALITVITLFSASLPLLLPSVILLVENNYAMTQTLASVASTFSEQVSDVEAIPKHRPLESFVIDSGDIAQVYGCSDSFPEGTSTS